jgi:hypothetical protein
MSKASVYKTRKQYESVRKHKLAMPVCQHCSRWGSYQEDNEAYDSAGVPLACAYPSLVVMNKAYQWMSTMFLVTDCI